MSNLMPYIAVYFYIVFGAMAYGVFEKGASHWLWGMGILLSLIFYGVMIGLSKHLLDGAIEIKSRGMDK